MRRRLIVSFLLAVAVALVQLLFGRTGWPVALLTGLVGFVVAFLVLLVADRSNHRRD
jgi:uncharacterized membrane protein YjjP (DUF1212 family)